MKKILSFLILAFVGLSLVIAQPQKMTYQTVVRDANNNLVVNQQVGLAISIFEDNANGPLVYSETHTASTNANGLVSVIVGMGIHAYPTSLADVQWGAHDHYLRVDIDPTGGINYTITGTTQLMTVPYAFYAGSVRYADTALYLKNFSDTAKYSIHSDTANYAYNAGNAATAINSIYADTADFNKLLNRPTGTNMGDILYWDTLSATWHILPVGSIGEVLTLDSNYVPQWNTGGGASCNLPTVVTNHVNNYTGYDANVSGAVTNGGGTQFVVGGFCWSQNANPTISDPYSMDGIGATSFTHNITGLNLGTTYHFRAYGMNAAGVAYGADETFTTWDYPAVTTYPTVSTISATTAYCGGNVTSDGGNYVNQRGVVWSSWNSNPDIDDNDGMTYDGSGTGSFQSYMTGLQQGTTYYVRAYATNSIGTVYGSTVSFTTLRTPVVSTNNVTDIDTMSAVSGGNVSSDGGDPVTDYGIVWSTSSWVNINNYIGITSHGAGTPPFTFTDTMKNLTPGQYYYVRAYATNSIGTDYGSAIQFRANPVAPTVTTNSVYNIYSYQATSGGNVTNNGGENVYQRGICWNTTGNPTTADYYTTNGSGNGSYTCYMNSLLAGTTYYVRAFATNSVGTSYGNEETFTTNAAAPSVTTNQTTGITATTAVYSGTVTHDGGDSVTARGIVWYDQNGYYNYWSCPDIYNYTGITSDGSGMGTFSDTLKNLTPGQTYWVVAYATNNIGTSYGYCEQFTTPTTVPNVNTNSISNIGANTAYCNAELIDNGGEYNAQLGVCWDTVPNPVIGNNNYTYDVDWYDYYGLTYYFSSYISGLKDSTTYWARAYATNNNGTSYGTAISFTTLKLPTVVTDPITGIGVTYGTSGVQVTADGGEMILTCGVCWDTTATPTINNPKTVIAVADNAPQSFSSMIQNLKDTTTYYVRAYATTSAGTGYGQTLSFTTLAFKPCPGVTTVSDTDGNVYKTVQIGSQCWMRDNLRTTRFADGGLIIDGTGYTSTSKKYKYYPGYYAGSNYVQTYGYLYNWAAVMHKDSSSSSNPSGVQGICPNGWHVPSNLEWQLLYNYVSGQQNCQCDGTASWIAKSLSSQTGWSSSTNNCAVGNNNSVLSNNITGLGLMPAGYNSNGVLNQSDNMGWEARYWSCTQYSSNDAYYWNIYSSNAYFGNSSTSKHYGHSVRCIKDDNSVADGQPCPGVPTVSDNDGNTYNTVLIGSQCWMKENLRTTKYPDGTHINDGTGFSTNTTVGTYYHVQNDGNNDAVYGLLYSWLAAMNNSNSSSAIPSGVRGICPSGWHIPSYDEWSLLTNYVRSGQYLCNNNSYSGMPLASNNNWQTSSGTCYVGNNLSANNASGFSAQPSGYYTSYNEAFRTGTMIWSTTEQSYDPTNVYTFYLYNSTTNAQLSAYSKYVFYGRPVRCLKD